MANSRDRVRADLSAAFLAPVSVRPVLFCGGRFGFVSCSAICSAGCPAVFQTLFAPWIALESALVLTVNPQRLDGRINVNVYSEAADNAQSSSRSRLAISTATRAASWPFSAWRACAWARFSVVKIALAIGSWYSSAKRVTAAPLSLATSSKW